MKNQEKTKLSALFSAADYRAFQDAYRKLEALIQDHPLLALGSINVIASPTGKELYTWTRKIRAKTKTVALSIVQAETFRKAAAANRAINEVLQELQVLSQTALITELPGVSKRRDKRSSISDEKPIQKGA